MTLAADLTRRLNLAPRRANRESTKFHLARVPGVRRLDGHWYGSVIIARRSWTLGEYPTPHRARLAIRLWEHWASCGYDVRTIPRQQENIY